MRRFANGVAVALALGTTAAAFGAGTGAGVPPPSPVQLARLAQPPVRPPLASQRIYFVMPDRYANGNPQNDRGRAAGSRSATGYDPSDPGYFHGGDYAGLTGDCTGPRGLARLRDLGLTGIWVTPPFRQKPVQGDSAGYHGYWGLDFTAVDPHLGTNDDFGAFVDCAHRLGLKVFLDVVVNHTADVIQLPSYEYGPPKTPFVPAGERDAKRPEWLNDAANYHNRGNIDFSSCLGPCLELGDFFGLDDLATERRNVRDGLVELYADWIRRYRLDGFRIDTAKHVERAFFPYWVPRILAAARTAGVRDFQLFGEVFETNAIELSTFVRERGLPNVLDFPMQEAIARFVGGSAGAGGIRGRLADDDYFILGEVTHVPPTFLGNHDIGRAALKVREGGAGAGGRLLERTLVGYDLLYLLRGAPVVYYGDEYGIIGSGGDKEARHDLFPTQVAHWRSEERIGSPPIGAGSSFDVTDHPVAERLRALGELRAAHPVLSTGASVVRRAGQSIFVISRIDATARREYVAAVNAGAAAARVAVTTATPSSEWTRLFGTAPAVSTNARGAFTLTLAPFSSLLLRAERQIPGGRPPRPSLMVGRDPLSELVRASAVAGTKPVSVAFAVKRASGAWRRIAVDDSPPYRAFLDPTDFRRRERVHVVAIARSLDGRLAVSAVRPFVPRR